MNKRRAALLGCAALLWALALTACGGGAANEGGTGSFFPKVDSPYTVELAVKNGDVVNVHGDYMNMDRWYEFLASVDLRKPDEVRITQYTIEGDPIFYELVYDGAAIMYTFDNAMDSYGVNQGRPTTVCTGFEKRAVGSAEGYMLTGCERPETGQTFWFADGKS